MEEIRNNWCVREKLYRPIGLDRVVKIKGSI